MNTRAKGNRTRLECIKFHCKDGWAVSIVERTGEFIKDKDLFGVGDLLCLKREDDKTVVRIVQTTSNRPHTHTLYKEFAKNFPGIQLQQWVKLDRKGWKVFEYASDGKRPKPLTLEVK